MANKPHEKPNDKQDEKTVPPHLTAKDAGKTAAQIMNQAFAGKGRTDGADACEAFADELHDDVALRISQEFEGVANQPQPVAAKGSAADVGGDSDDVVHAAFLRRLVARQSIDSATGDAIREALAELDERKGVKKQTGPSPSPSPYRY